MKQRTFWAAALVLFTASAEAQYLSAAVCEAEDTPPALCEMAHRLFNPNRYYWDPKLHDGRARLPHVQLRRGWMNREGGWTVSHVPPRIRYSLRAQFLRREPEAFDHDGKEYHLWGFEVVLWHNRQHDGYYYWRDVVDAGRYQVLVNAIYDPAPNDQLGSWTIGPAFGRVGDASWATGSALHGYNTRLDALSNPWMSPRAARTAIHRLLDRCLAHPEMRNALALLDNRHAVEWCDPDS